MTLKMETDTDTTQSPAHCQQPIVRASRDTYPFREGYPFQVWHSVNCWNHKQGQVIHCHAKTLEVAQKEASTLRLYKILGRNGPTKKNYYGRVTIRRCPNDLRQARAAKGVDDTRD